MSEQDIDKRNDDVAADEVANDAAEAVTDDATTDAVAVTSVDSAAVDDSTDAATATHVPDDADDSDAADDDAESTTDESGETDADEEAEPQPVAFSVVYDEDDTDDAPIAFAIDGTVDAVDTDDTYVDVDAVDAEAVDGADAVGAETAATGGEAGAASGGVTAGATAETADSAAASPSETAQHDDAEDTAEAPEEEIESDAVPRETSAAATAANAKRVNETLALNATAKPSIDAAADPNEVKASMTRSERTLDQQVGDRVLLKSYPTFSLNHVTTTNRKTGRHVLDNVSIACYAGSLAAIRVLPDEDDPEQRVTLMEVLGGYQIPTSGTAMTKSSNLAELEITELRGHRLGIIPQRYAVRGDLDAESNVRYAMDASGRTYLKPKPVIARELLDRVGFGEATSGKPLRTMTLVEQRRVAIARAISCEADVVIADEPTKGLDADDAREILALLASIAHARDPKRLVIVVTASDEVADAADQVFRLAD